MKVGTVNPSGLLTGVAEYAHVCVMAGREERSVMRRMYCRKFALTVRSEKTEGNHARNARQNVFCAAIRRITLRSSALPVIVGGRGGFYFCVKPERRNGPAGKDAVEPDRLLKVRF